MVLPYCIGQEKDGTTRFCVDFRKVNDLTKKDAHPLPRIDDTLDALGGAQWFTTLDLASGYWQVEVNSADREKTAFATPDGLYQFRVMPFGLCNAPSTFQRLMERVLQGLHWSSCLVYLDDIIIYSKTIGEHLTRLAEVFLRLREAKLKIKPSKCHLLRKSIHYLGHVVSRNGVETDPTKIKCIVQWPAPSNTKELKQFLGMCSYYRRFVRSFAKIAAPLHRLSEKGNAWLWTDECQQAFDTLKHQLVSAPILSLPNFSHDFILDIDASGNGLGAVLSQAIDGNEQVVAYGSRALTKAERKYCATRRELLALVWGVRHFRPYLYGRKFIVRTDHNSLRWLHNFRDPEGQVARWLEILSEYSFDVVHRPGLQHSNADALSRLPCNQCGLHEEVKDGEQEPGIKEVTMISTIGMQAWTPEEIQSLQAGDVALNQFSHWLSVNSVPSTFPKGAHSHLQTLWTQRQYLLLKDGILYRKWEDVPGRGLNKRLQLVLPKEMAAEILSKLHNSSTAGHLGVRKTLEKVQSRFYLVRQRQDVAEWCKACPVCASRKSGPRKVRAPMQLEFATRPLQRIAMDILGPLPCTERGNRYILVVGDYFTKWKEAYPMKNMEATTVARILVQEFICRFGIPESLHTDQGRNFESDLIKEVCKLLDIKKTRTSAYHPQSDGMIERTLLNMLSTALEKNQSEWDSQLPVLMLAYRTSMQETTGATPFSLMFGRSACLPIDVEFNLPSPNYGSLGQYQNHLQQQLRQPYMTVREHSSVEQARQKRWYDRSVYGPKYKVGDEVWLHCPAVPKGRCKKFHRPWQGPFTVVKIIDNFVYRRIRKNAAPYKRLVVHYNRLKPCHPPFNTDVYGPDSSRVHTSTNQEQQQPEVKMAIDHTALLEAQNHSNTPQDTATTNSDPPLRRSIRTRQPPDRYGEIVSYPDCYTSDSDSD